MRMVIHGIVQGVGFRPTVHRIATSMGLSGYVQNNGSNVVIEIDGDAKEFLERLREALPPLARIDSINVTESGPMAAPKGKGFVIVPSEKGEKGVGIPNDVAICESCRKEMFDPSDRRYLYLFTNCTDCGARFTVIDDLPYDRANTSMKEFVMCEECAEEYASPSDRRFHHQTVSCPTCGPRYRLLDKEGREVEGDPIERFAEMLQEGAIGIAKSWGGMHICCTLETLPRLRTWYRRREKPFAVMFRDMGAVERLGEPTEFEKKILMSTHRPVVLIRKRDVAVNELIAPGLGNIGAFLPYTGMHHILFHYLKGDALVMTSANVPGEPMVLRDEDAIALKADCYLLHNREIVNRCDDSVLRTFEDKTFFIRKSRGHIPSGIDIGLEGTAVGLGAQENISGAISRGKRVYQTQYIGDGSSIGVMDFLESAIGYQRKLLGVERIEAIGIDMHPAYATRRLGRTLSERWRSPLVQVQHHWAHAASLLVDAGMEEIVALTLDGTGYGADGKLWGGEILYADFEGHERIGHLQEIPLLGGEKAVRDPRRIAFTLSEMAGRETAFFSEGEADILRKLMAKSPVTTSFGRILDALSCHFGICCSRTYEGEPAMKLEKHIESGKRAFDFTVERKGNVIQTVPLFQQLLGSEGSADDKARSFVHALLEEMVDIAAVEAASRGIESIGITGGVSYNHAISLMAKELIEGRGFRFVCHNAVPNGDGGITIGQCAVPLAMQK